MVCRDSRPLSRDLGGTHGVSAARVGILGPCSKLAPMRRILLALAATLLLSCRPPTERLVSAAYEGDHDAVAAALREKGVDLNAKVEIDTYLYFRSLTAAAAGGHVEIARLLLDAGADPNQGAGDVTPLLMAAKWRHADVVRLLLARGADAKHADKDGKGPLLYLFENSCDGDEKELAAMAKALLEAGADPNTATKYGDQPFVRAVGCGHREVVRAFLAHGAKLDGRGRLSSGASTELTTPLHVAVQAKNLEIMKDLLAAGASFTARDHRGRTPCEVATGPQDNTRQDPRIEMLADAGDACAKSERQRQARWIQAQERALAERVKWGSPEKKEEPAPTSSANQSSTNEPDPLQDASDRYRRAIACPSGTTYCGSSCCGSGLMCCMPDGASQDGNGMCIAQRAGHGCPWGTHRQ